MLPPILTQSWQAGSTGAAAGQGLAEEEDDEPDWFDGPQPSDGGGNGAAEGDPYLYLYLHPYPCPCPCPCPYP